MQVLEQYARKAFLRDHPPIMKKIELTSGLEEQTLLAGTVIGKKDTTVGIYKAQESEEPIGILVEDVTVPKTGNAIASIYIHADIVQEHLIFDDTVNAENQKTAIAKLRGQGLYIY